MFVKRYRLVVDKDTLVDSRQTASNCGFARDLNRSQAERAPLTLCALLFMTFDKVKDMDSDIHEGFKEVNLFQVFELAFLHPRRFDKRPQGLELKDVDRTPDGWSVTVVNDAGESRTV